MESLKTIADHRATRHFSDIPVSQPDVERILEVARWTGSARNRQPWRFVSVANPRLQRQLSGLGQYAAHLASAPVALVLLSDEISGLDTEFDLGRICQSIVLAAHAVGLGSCPVTIYPDENAITAARLVGATAPWRANHILAIGWPAPAASGTSAIPSGRMPVGEILTHIGDEAEYDARN